MQGFRRLTLVAVLLLAAAARSAPTAAAPPPWQRAPVGTPASLPQPFDSLRRLVLSAPPELQGTAGLQRGAKIPELLQAARRGSLSARDVATFAQSAHPDLLRALERRAGLPGGFFVSTTRSVQLAGGNPFQAATLPDLARQTRLRGELGMRLDEIVRLHRARGGRLLLPALQLLTSVSPLASPARSGRYAGAIRTVVDAIPLPELERRHAYVMRLSPAEVLAQMPSRAALRARSGLVSFDHLLHTIGHERDGKLLIDVYAENMPAPGRIARYLPVAALGEGSYCVDDIARATVALLQAYRSAPRAELLRSARAGLSFVRTMQAPDGAFFNFASLGGGRLEVNRRGSTSRKGIDFWAVRAVWALGEATLALSRADPRGGAAAARALERTLPRLEAPLQRYGQWNTVEGQRVPAWLINDAADQTAVAVKGLLSYYQALPAGPQRERVLRLVRAYCEGIAAAQVTDPRAADRGRFLHSLKAPGERHLWGSQQVEVLAQAGKLLRRADWVAAAALCADHYWARHTPASIVEPGEAQIAYGVETVVSGYARLFEATGRPAHAEAAFRWGSWFFGNNAARALMYDPVSGRGYDGITHLRGRGGRTGYAVSLNAGAESTIEALLAMQSAARVPGLERRLREYLAAQLPR